MPAPSTETTAHIGSAIDRAQAYDRIAVTAEIVLPFLSPERAARVRLTMSLAERSTSGAICSCGSGPAGGPEAGQNGNRCDRNDVR